VAQVQNIFNTYKKLKSVSSKSCRKNRFNEGAKIIILSNFEALTTKKTFWLPNFEGRAYKLNSPHFKKAISALFTEGSQNFRPEKSIKNRFWTKSRFKVEKADIKFRFFDLK